MLRTALHAHVEPSLGTEVAFGRIGRIDRSRRTSGVTTTDSQVSTHTKQIQSPATAHPTRTSRSSVPIISSMTRRADSERVGHAVTKAAKRGSAETAALSAAPLDSTSDFPDDSDRCSSPTGGASKASPFLGRSFFVLRISRIGSRIGSSVG